MRITNTVVPIFAATIRGKQATNQESTEAIADTFALSFPKIKQAFHEGFYIHNGQKAFFRDPFLAYAVLLYEIGLRSSPSRSPKLP